MTILVLGINHNTAPVELRERVAFAPEQMLDALEQLKQNAEFSDAVILSTCNRTEVYCSGDDLQVEMVVAWMSQYHQLDKAQLVKFIYHYQDLHACKHIMRVASGLDSMVLGEPQILGQIKQAFKRARNVGTVCSLFQRLFQHSFFVAKQVRTQTDIGANAVSVAYAAVNLAKHIFGQLAEARVLLIGAGETIELVAKHLLQQGSQQMTVANRTLSRAEDLAQQIGGEVVSLAKIPEQLVNSDIVISSTASVLPIIGKGMVEAALKKRRYKPIFLVDLAVPRDVEGQVSDLDDAYLYTIDDLQMIVGDNLDSRNQAAKAAEQIILEQAEVFQRTLHSLNSVAVIRQYREQCHQVKQILVKRAKSQIQAGQDPEKIIEELAYKLTNKLMHAPTQSLKNAAQDDELEQLHMIKNILGIE